MWSSRRALAVLLTALVFTFGAIHEATGQAAPAGEVIIAWHVTIAPTWFDPSSAPPQITPFGTIYAIHDALARPMPNQKIGARSADSMALYLARTLKQAQLVEISEPKGTEGIQGVLSGQWDAFGTNRQRLTEALRNTPGVRLLKDDLYGVEQTLIVPKDDQENLKAVNQFIDDIRTSGFLRAAIERSGINGIAVAPPAIKKVGWAYCSMRTDRRGPSTRSTQ